MDWVKVIERLQIENKKQYESLAGKGWSQEVRLATLSAAETIRILTSALIDGLKTGEEI